MDLLDLMFPILRFLVVHLAYPAFIAFTVYCIGLRDFRGAFDFRGFAGSLIRRWFG